MKRFLATLILAFITQVMAQPIALKPQYKVDSIAVVVNKDVITQKEWDDKVNVIEANLRSQGINPPRDELARQVLERMIIDSVQVQMAKERGIYVDDRQLDSMVAMVAENNNMTLEQFEKRLIADGTTLAAFRENMRNDVTRQRLRDMDVVSKVEVSDSEVDHYLNMEQDEPKEAPVSTGEEVRLGHILIRIPENASAEQIDGRRDRAETVLRNLRAGSSFQQNAATYSDGDEGLNGGDMGWRSYDRLPSLFVDAIRRLNKGEITGILKSANGFHILKVLDRRQGAAPSHQTQAKASKQVEQIHVRHILIKVNQLVSAEEAKHKIVELKERLINRAATFEELARTHSQDGSAARGGDLGWIYPGDTVPEFEKVIVKLPIGELSEPVETQFGFHLIEVLERRIEDASLERKRAAIKQALRERKIEEATEDWLRQLRDRAYVDYRFQLRDE